MERVIRFVASMGERLRNWMKGQNTFISNPLCFSWEFLFFFSFFQEQHVQSQASTWELIIIWLWIFLCFWARTYHLSLPKIILLTIQQPLEMSNCLRLLILLLFFSDPDCHSFQYLYIYYLPASCLNPKPCNLFVPIKSVKYIFSSCLHQASILNRR